MVDFLNTSLSGLRVAQRSLATTSNNIANAATEGYNRQQVDIASRPSEFTGGGYIGTGSQVVDIRRSYDEFLVDEVRTGTAGQARLETFAQLAGRVGDLLGNESGGLSQGLQSFFDSLQSLANNPASTPVRQSFLSEAEALTRRIGDLDRQLSAIESETSGRISDSVSNINSLAQAIAETNDQIASSPGAANGSYPTDLLDQRDRLLQRLSEQVEVSVVPGSMGVVNVFVGSGQSLVLGDEATPLTSGASAFGPGVPEVSLGGSVVTNQLNGGVLGGLLDFKREVLEPARNELGRTAVAITESFNAQHRQGVDLGGDFGGDFFAVGEPSVYAASTNTGGAEVSAAITSAAGLTGDDYELKYDGTNYTLVNTTRGELVTMTGTGTAADPLLADGLSIVVDDTAGAPAAGDRFVIQPTRNAAGDFASLVANPEDIAAASPLRTAASFNNVSDAAVSDAEVLDATNPALQSPVTIRFTSDTEYQLIDSNTDVVLVPTGVDPDPVLPADGGIEYNGYRVEISGSPVAGDEFTVEANTAGVGDNRNAQALSALRDVGVLEGGERSLFEQADTLLANVGGATAAAQIGLESQTALLRSSESALQSVSGVNLEEEAANLILYQQAYEANARVIQAANSTFQSLLDAIR